ncbi:MAG: hypothetical protein AUJ92_05040 [Armatimonadetes bacterium CG2_30_59_28]|nr:hypothetical protein [Armatimonadota bacterium]OIO96802.1 MAG: hypothetical protein AUJ92_05040 [Armatimonadetes bacterium CG2_30_59_28]PIU62227.1 MAG: hypothetical protein COS85_19195 [Armatimonadetes bacterium CG07_land_8_20_14_0_80_59_28]PIX42352.1 MAG: hypothetical protein COZ56_09570 [Armatimonadetes bacterium CG_4_8_14_3_um_filter_58_9]PIY42034.1 MAG: hypothetical protein COZ05_14690 [Armatimonadetes bacterium CG_4_10_14_3_um_filter_59_10]
MSKQCNKCDHLYDQGLEQCPECGHSGCIVVDSHAKVDSVEVEAEHAREGETREMSREKGASAQNVYGWNWTAFLVPVPWCLGHRLWWQAAIIPAAVLSFVLASCSGYSASTILKLEFVVSLFHIPVGLSLLFEAIGGSSLILYNNGFTIHRTILGDMLVLSWLIWGVVLGIMGNHFAWQRHCFKSVSHLRSDQDAWKVCGFVLVLLGFLLRMNAVVGLGRLFYR